MNMRNIEEHNFTIKQIYLFEATPNTSEYKTDPQLMGLNIYTFKGYSRKTRSEL